MKNFSDRIKAAAELVSASQVANDTGTADQESKAWDKYLDAHGDGVTQDVVNNVHGLEKDFTTGAVLAQQDAALKTFEGGKDVHIAVIGMGGKNSVTVTTKKSHEVPNGVGEKATGSITKFGSTTAKIHVEDFRADVGTVKAARETIADVLTEALK